MSKCVQVMCIENFWFNHRCELTINNTYSCFYDKHYDRYVCVEGFNFYLGDYRGFIESGKHPVGLRDSVDFYKYFKFLDDYRAEQLFKLDI